MRPLAILFLSSLAYAQNVAAPLGLCPSPTGSLGAAYTCPAPVLFTYFGNLSVSWTPDTNNTTTAPTLNLGPGPKTLKDVNGNTLTMGAITGGGVYIVAYDGTNIRILSGPPNNTVPTLAACGSSPVITGTNRSGTVTEGTGASGCVITFSVPYLAIPGCTVSSQKGLGFTYTVTPSGIKILNVGALSSTILNYACPQ